ncbi:MAG: DNA primase [Victivallaceae bacterium]|nr:DNA primase [Victivallaceae bacterium]
MAIIPNDVVEEIRARCGIVDVISRVVPLKRAGNGSWKACCPFHQEKTPSFVVSEQRQRYHCFGCGAGGDVFKFVMMTENVDFPNAIHLLADRCGVVIPEDSSASPAEQAKQRERADYRERLYRLLEDFTVFFQRTLANRPDSEVARYLATRDLDPDAIKKFRIGAAPDSWDEGMKFGLARGYTEKEMLDAGVILQNEESGRIYDRFRNRLVFAIWNEQGKVVGFSARTVEKEAGGAKYVNSPETAVFKKSRILYALPLARTAIGAGKQVILCEGQLDVIAMHRAGFACAVAPQGTSFTEEQAQLLRRYTDRVLLAFDSDAAGQKAILRAVEILFPLGFEVRVLAIPEGKDPDDLFRRHGVEAVAATVDNSIDILDFLIKALRPQFDLDSPFGQSRFLEAVLAYVDKLPDPVVRETCARRLSELLQLKVELIYAEMRNLRRAHFAPAAKRAAAKPEAVIDPADLELRHAETTLLSLALLSEAMARRIGDEVTPDQLSESAAARALNRVTALALNGEYDSAAPELNALDRELGDAILSRILTDPEPLAPERQEQALEECLTALRRRRAGFAQKKLLDALRSAQTAEEKAKILAALQKL